MRWLPWLGMFFAILSFTAGAEAATLRVAPVILNLTAPAAASSIQVWNEGAQPVSVQIRVFRWTQVNGQDVLEPTNAVVASPPIATLPPGGVNVVRIVRTARGAVDGEESYRLLIDELPDPAAPRGVGVSLVMRHSIPVFFNAANAAAPAVSWSIALASGGYLVTARNDGATRLKVTNLALGDAAGRSIGGREGLVGYVLGHSIASWVVPATGGGPRAGAVVTISAVSESGPFNASARLPGG